MKVKKLNLILQVARKERGLTQCELAERAGMKQCTLSRIENSDFYPVSLERWSLLFGCIGYEIDFDLKEIK